MYEYSNMTNDAFEEQGVSCPSDTDPNTPFTGWGRFINPNLSVLYNNWFGMRFGAGFTAKLPVDYMIKPGSIKRPSICGQMIEGHVDSGLVSSYCMQWFVAWGMATYKVQFRHNNRSKVAYVDGHVNSLSYLEIMDIPVSYNTLGKRW